jgi:DNA-binding Lrp family transcriptional regulator
MNGATVTQLAFAAAPAAVLDGTDRRLIHETQGGLPLVEQPYHELARRIGTTPGEVMRRLRELQARGAIRRIGAVPNHYRLGYVANGMSVWDVADARVDELGRRVAQLAGVSHCYQRPRHLPDWPYNLFVMLHGRTRAEVEAQVAEVARLLGSHSRSHDVLYSTRILKKTGLRLT